MEVLTWFLPKKEFKGKPQLHINQWYGESTAFKDFTLQQQCRFNRFSQSASSGWRVMCVLVLLRVYICASTNYSGRDRSPWLRAQNQRSADFLEEKGELSESCGCGATAPALTPIMSGNTNSWWIRSLPSWPQQRAHVTYRLFTQAARQDSQARGKSA